MPISVDFTNGPIDTGNAPPAQDDSAPVLSTNIAPTGQPQFQQSAADTLKNTLTYGLPMLGVGAIDTLGQSLHVWHNDSVPKFLAQLSPTAGNYYAQNQDALRAGGELATFWAPGVAGLKLLNTVNGLREAGTLGVWAKDAKSLDVLLGNSADLAETERALAASAKTGTSNMGLFSGRTLTDFTRGPRAAYTFQRVVQGARQGAAFEAANYAAFNQSTLFSSPDASWVDQAMWAGAGIGAGAILEGAAARYTSRKLLQGAVDASAVSKEVSASKQTLDQVFFRPGLRGPGITVSAQARNDAANFITQNSSNEGSATLVSRLTQDTHILDTQIRGQLEALGRDPAAGFPNKKIDDETAAVFSKALAQNSNLLLYSQKLSPLPKGGFLQWAESTSANLAELQAKAAVPKPDESWAPEIQALQSSLKKNYIVLNSDGSPQLWRERPDAWLDTNRWSDIRATGKTIESTILDAQGVQGKPISVPTYAFEGPGGKGLLDTQDFSFKVPDASKLLDYSALYAAGAKAIREWKPIAGQPEVTLTKDMPWRQLEMLHTLMEDQPKSILGNGGFLRLDGKDFKSQDDVAFHILDGKFKELQDMAPYIRGQGTPQQFGTPADKMFMTPQEAYQSVNLPLPSTWTGATFAEFLGGAKLQNASSLYDIFPGASFQDGMLSRMSKFRNAFAEASGIPGPATKGQFDAGLLRQASDVPPTLIHSDYMPVLGLGEIGATARMEALRQTQLASFLAIDETQAPNLARVIGRYVGQTGELTGAANVARQVQRLADGVVSGTGQLVYQDAINAQHPVLQALSALVDADRKDDVQNFANLTQETLKPLFSDILSKSSAPALRDYNRLEHSYRFGFEVARPVTDAGFPGRAVFPLLPTENNKQLLRTTFPDLTENEINQVKYLPDMALAGRRAGLTSFTLGGEHPITPLAVLPQAANLGTAISDISVGVGREYNVMRQQLGRTPIKLREFHLPSPELSKEGGWFVRNSTGDVVQTYATTNYSANARDAKKAAEALVQQHGPGYVAVPIESVKTEHLLGDQSFQRLIDYSDPAANTGVRMTGALAQNLIDTTPNTLKATVQTLQEQYLELSNRARTFIFEPEVSWVQNARSATTAADKDPFATSSIFDRYIAMMQGRNPSMNGNGIFQRVYNTANDAFDRAQTYAMAHFMGDTSTAKTLRRVLAPQSSQSEFDQWAKDIPTWSPFNNIDDFYESTFKRRMPMQLRDVISPLSRTASTMILRFANAGTAVMNILGVPAVLPAVVANLRKLPTETEEEFLGRTASWASAFSPEFATFSPVKALASASKMYWNGSLDAAISRAVAKGMLEPEFSSLSNAWAAPSTAKRQKLADLVSWTTKLADSSEVLSRKLTWGIGYGLAKHVRQFENEEDAFLFANHIVNETIGNYASTNRPAMFSGSIGQPLGAFQTYAFNAFRRIFSHVEQGDRAALLAQYASQSLLFGVKQLPGFDAWNKLSQLNDNTGDDFETRVNRNLPAGVGDLLMHGTVSNIPKIFTGLQGDAFALYTRGTLDQTQLPVVGGSLPAVEFLKNTWDLATHTIKNFMAEGGFSLQQQEEILATYGTSGAIQRLMEFAADAKVDRKGQMVADHTRDALSVAAALLGTQKASIVARQQALSKERIVQLNQSNLRSDLDERTRALVRSGNFNEQDLRGLASGYLQSGGNPAYFGQWFRNNLMVGLTPKAELTLQKLGSTGKLDEFANLLATMQQNYDYSSRQPQFGPGTGGQ